MNRLFKASAPALIRGIDDNGGPSLRSEDMSLQMWQSAMMQVLAAGSGGVVGPWNTADKDSSVTLSNAGSTATSTGSSGFYGVRGLLFKSSGTGYFEMLVDRPLSFGLSLGIATAAAPLGTGSPGQSVANGATYRSDGYLTINAALDPQTGTSYTTGDTIGFDVSVTAKQITFYKNNSDVAGTYSYTTASPVAPYAGLFNVGQAATLKTVGPFTYSSPKGYPAWG